MSEGQRPSAGRIVLFTPKPGEQANGAAEYVAIIGQVFSDAGNAQPYCNLYVLPPFGFPRWEGSVQEGTGPRTWRWPPRV